MKRADGYGKAAKQVGRKRRDGAEDRHDDDGLGDTERSKIRLRRTVRYIDFPSFTRKERLGELPCTSTSWVELLEVLPKTMQCSA